MKPLLGVSTFIAVMLVTSCSTVPQQKAASNNSTQDRTVASSANRPKLKITLYYGQKNQKLGVIHRELKMGVLRGRVDGATASVQFDDFSLPSSVQPISWTDGKIFIHNQGWGFVITLNADHIRKILAETKRTYLRSSHWKKSVDEMIERCLKEPKECSLGADSFANNEAKIELKFYKEKGNFLFIPYGDKQKEAVVDIWNKDELLRLDFKVNDLTLAGD